ncbi:MAG TPA: hypothetical protein DIC64_01190 [Alphaproteobacteria bacterium]|nr:hypothetical protein [Alphaproteobacteria bacterium]
MFALNPYLNNFNGQKNKINCAQFNRFFFDGKRKRRKNDAKAVKGCLLWILGTSPRMTKEKNS